MWRCSATITRTMSRSPRTLQDVATTMVIVLVLIFIELPPESVMVAATDKAKMMMVTWNYMLSHKCTW